MSKNILPILQGVSFAIFALGILFRIQHWAYGFELIISGAGLLLFTILIRLFNKKRQKLSDLLGTVFISVLVLYYLSRMLNWGYSNEIRWGLILVGVFFGATHLYDRFLSKETEEEDDELLDKILEDESFIPINRKRIFATIVLHYIGIGLVVVGAIFKTQHLPGASALLITGLIVTAGSYIIKSVN